MRPKPPIRALVDDSHRRPEAGPREKEVTRRERGAREAFTGFSRDLLQFRDRLAH